MARRGQQADTTPAQPLAEVFGVPSDDVTPSGVAHRDARDCPFHNKYRYCTKARAENPIGVCSIYDNQRRPVIVCPVRFREGTTGADQLIAHAAGFFFPGAQATAGFREVRLTDSDGKRAGNIDLVVVSFDPATGNLLDFGALEIQSVYISGNISNPFNHYMQDQANRAAMDWRGQPKYPRPDYLSSSRKRLIPQLITKGGILSAWGKKQAVAVDTTFFERFGDRLTRVAPEQADLLWLIYDLVRGSDKRYHLTLLERVYTAYDQALAGVTQFGAGPVTKFEAILQGKLAIRLAKGDVPPDTDAGPELDADEDSEALDEANGDDE